MMCFKSRFVSGVVLLGLLSFSCIVIVGASSVMWSLTYGGIGHDLANMLVGTSDGGFALAGGTSSFGAGEADFWLVKTDGSGNIEWIQTDGGENYDVAYALVGTSDGGFALAGETNSFGAGEADFWLVKTDENGIIPEFSSWIILPLFLTATLFIIILKKRRLQLADQSV